MTRRLLSLLAAVVLTASFSVHATDGKGWMSEVDSRSESPWQTATMELTVIPKGGTPQVREAAAYSHLTPERRESAVYFKAPGAMKKTAFLSIDNIRSSADEQWLYLPALQTVRRIPTSSRGGSFIGTDLSYEDVQRVGKVGLEDYQFSSPSTLPNNLVQVSGTATPAAAKELAHIRAEWVIDPKSRFIVEARYFDAQGALIKKAWVSDIEQLGGFWTARTVKVENLLTGSQTMIRFKDVVFGQAFDTAILSSKGLQSAKGLK